MMRKRSKAAKEEWPNLFGLDAEITRASAPRNFLKLFYPYHYSVGMAVEKHMKGDDLDRHQAVILWIIHTKGDKGRSLPRKTIEALIGDWYELGSPAITKALRKLASPPLRLIAIEESASSGREKMVRLTEAGALRIKQMIRSTEAFIKTISDHLTDEEIQVGTAFMDRVGTIMEVDLKD
jgi:DNA-binding PadR family transcriptional regulator